MGSCLACLLLGAAGMLYLVLTGRVVMSSASAADAATERSRILPRPGRGARLLRFTA